MTKSGGRRSATPVERALDAVADLLAKPPPDIVPRYLDVVCEAASAETGLILRETPGDGVGFTGFDAAGVETRVPEAAARWLRGLRDASAVTKAGLFAAGTTALAATVRDGEDRVAVVALSCAAGFPGRKHDAFLATARFGPAVLREARSSATRAGSGRSADAARLEQFGRASPDIFFILNARTFAAEYVSSAFEAVHGRRAEDATAAGEGAEVDVVPEDREIARSSAERARGGEVDMVEYRIRRETDGVIRWIRATDFPLRSASGRIERVGRIARDVTDARIAAEESRQLQDELQHRVRNALGVIRALVRRTAETSQTLEDLASHLDGRINAFARVQSALARNPTAGLDLENLLADEILTSTLHQAGRVTLKGPAIALTPKAAETLGLILHELATNAVEHGTLGTDKGRLRVTWEVRPERDVPRLVLEWAERGPARDMARPTHRGFGTELLEKTLPYELNGSASLRFERQGLRCVLEVPLTPLVLARSG